jgi:hypothetical protein
MGFFLATTDRGSGRVDVLEAVLGVFWKNPSKVFWFFMFWVFEVDFFKAGVGVAGNGAAARALSLAMLAGVEQLKIKSVDPMLWCT